MTYYYHPYIPTNADIKKYLISKKKYMWKRKKYQFRRFKYGRFLKPWLKKKRRLQRRISTRLSKSARRLLIKFIKRLRLARKRKRKFFNVKKHKVFTRNRKTIARKHHMKRYIVYAYRWYRTRGKIATNNQWRALTGQKTLSAFTYSRLLDLHGGSNWNPVTLLRILDTHHPLVSVKMGFNLPTLSCYDNSFFLYKHLYGDWKRDCLNSM